MRSRILVLAALALPVLAAGCIEQPVAPTSRDAVSALDRSAAVTGTPHVLVLLRGSEKSDFAKAVAAIGGTITRRHSGAGLIEISGIPTGAEVALKGRPDVDQVVRDQIIQWVPNPGATVRLADRAGFDPGRPRAGGTDQSGAFFFPDQWNMRQIAADQAWGPTPAGAGQLVYVLDSGIDPDHLDLSGKVDMGCSRSFITQPVFDGDLDPIDYFFHGTYVSSQIVSNGFGMASVAPDARICMFKVLNVLGSGSFSDLIAAIITAAEEGATVINMSLGAYLDTHDPATGQLVAAVQGAVNFANSRGTLVVASAGNDGVDLDTDFPTFMSVPAQLKNVISVAATAPINQQDFDLLASYSNFGHSGVDLAAPGGDLVDGGVLDDLVIGACSEFQLVLPFACTSIDYIFGAGTSAAAPHVTGALAVTLSRFGPAKPSAVEACLKRGTDNIGSPTIFGSGRLNVVGAASCGTGSL